MNADHVQHEVVRVFLPALVLGTLGAPIVFIASAFIAPAGFMDLQGASASTVLSALSTAWAFSLVLTVPIAAAMWHFLHSRRFDGLASYGVIGLIVAALATFLVTQRPPSGHFVGMVLANAVLVRLVERAMRSTSGRGYPGVAP